MKRIIFVSLIFILGVCVALLCACQTETAFTGVKVVYELEGGTYQTGGRYIQYYNFEKGTQNLIKDLRDLGDEDDLEKVGYEFVDWYTKDADGNYAEKWDFATDTVGDDGVTLYAMWEPTVSYYYEIYDIETGELRKKVTMHYEKIPLDTDDATARNYTLLDLYEDAEGTIPWGTSADKTPTQANPTVKLYGKYIEGTYAVVRTASDLTSAMTSNTSIYVYCDIDMEGASLRFNALRSTSSSAREFCGNNHTISNFSVYYNSSKEGLVTDSSGVKNCLMVSLFINPNGVNIHDVTFQNVTINVTTTNTTIQKIYIAPLAAEANGTTVKNVTITGELTIGELPENILANKEKLLLVETSDPFINQTDCTVEYFKSEITISTDQSNQTEEQQ